MNNWLLLALAISCLIVLAAYFDGNDNQNGFSA